MVEMSTMLPPPKQRGKKMYEIKFYQVQTTGRWKWKIDYQNSTVSRSENSYSTRGQAKRAWSGFEKKLVEDRNYAINESR